MEGRASIHWPDCARRNSRPIPSPAACLCSAAGVARRSASWSMTAKDFGWRRSGFRRGRFVWWPSGKEPARRLEAHQAQLLLAAGNPETAAAPVWRKVS